MFCNCGPEFCAGAPRLQGNVDEVIICTVRATVGIERMLKCRAQHDALVCGEYILGAVAVMHIEINNRDSFKPVLSQGVRCTDGDVVEMQNPIAFPRSA